MTSQAALDAEWERCKGWIGAALEYDSGFYTLDDVKAEIDAREAVLWPGEQSAVVTQFWHFPRNVALNYWLAGGDMDELINKMRPCIETWAKALGCTDIIIAGRKGWGRVLGDVGYQPVWTAFRKALSE